MTQTQNVTVEIKNYVFDLFGGKMHLTAMTPR